MTTCLVDAVYFKPYKLHWTRPGFVAPMVGPGDNVVMSSKLVSTPLSHWPHPLRTRKSPSDDFYWKSKIALWPVLIFTFNRKFEILTVLKIGLKITIQINFYVFWGEESEIRIHCYSRARYSFIRIFLSFYILRNWKKFLQKMRSFLRSGPLVKPSGQTRGVIIRKTSSNTLLLPWYDCSCKWNTER